jgi:hypothetical protein
MITAMGGTVREDAGQRGSGRGWRRGQARSNLVVGALGVFEQLPSIPRLMPQPCQFFHPGPELFEHRRLPAVDQRRVRHGRGGRIEQVGDQPRVPRIEAAPSTHRRLAPPGSQLWQCSVVIVLKAHDRWILLPPLLEQVRRFPKRVDLVGLDDPVYLVHNRSWPRRVVDHTSLFFQL